MELSLNYAAILVAAIVNFIVGAVWHGPLFGKHWMKLAGITHEEMKRMPLTPAQAMLLGFVNTLLMTFVLSLFGNTWNPEGVTGAFTLAFWPWLGFVVPMLANSVLWEGKSWKLFGFNISYQLVSLFVTALVLVSW